VWRLNLLATPGPTPFQKNLSNAPFTRPLRKCNHMFPTNHLLAELEREREREDDDIILFLRERERDVRGR